VRSIAVDGSGAASPSVQRRTIWVAEADDGRLVSLSAGRTREETVDYLCTRETDVIGLDFAFSLPRWFLGQEDGREVWDAVTTRGEEWLQACAPPFWGRPGRPRPHTHDRGLRRTERETPGTRSVFQIGGAGSVGTGSLRGMPFLRRLTVAGLSVWPFDRWEPPVVAEVWPRSVIGRIVKSRESERMAHLPAAASSEDAFDAGCTAIALSLSQPPTIELDAVDRSEGRIFNPSLQPGTPPLGGPPAARRRDRWRPPTRGSAPRAPRGPASGSRGRAAR
jgi:predicted nuclease with RNAse H fold